MFALVAILADPARRGGARLDLPKGGIVDLSHPYDAQTIFWPTESGFVLEKEHDGLTEKGYYYRSNKFSSPEHGGTHIDAPAHFAKDGNTVDAIPLDQLVGSAVMVDVSRKCLADRDYRIAHRRFPRLGEGASRDPAAHDRAAAHRVRQDTGPTARSYLGTDEQGPAAVAELHFPGLDPAAAAWLVSERKIKAVGLDTASIDYGQSTGFEAHVELMTHGVPGDGESREPRPLAADGDHGGGLADEDRRRQRRAAACDCHRRAEMSDLKGGLSRPGPAPGFREDGGGRGGGGRRGAGRHARAGATGELRGVAVVRRGARAARDGSQANASRRRARSSCSRLPTGRLHRRAASMRSPAAWRATRGGATTIVCSRSAPARSCVCSPRAIPAREPRARRPRSARRASLRARRGPRLARQEHYASLPRRRLVHLSRGDSHQRRARA